MTKTRNLTDAEIDHVLEPFDLEGSTRIQRRVIAKYVTEHEVLLAACKRVLQRDEDLQIATVIDEVRAAVALVEG